MTVSGMSDRKWKAHDDIVRRGYTHESPNLCALSLKQFQRRLGLKRGSAKEGKNFIWTSSISGFVCDPWETISFASGHFLEDR